MKTDLKGENWGDRGLPGRNVKIQSKPMTKTELDFFFLWVFFSYSGDNSFVMQFKGGEICKQTKTATETSQASEALGTAVMEVDLVDTEITVMQYECLLLMTVYVFISCKCTMYTASNLSRSVVERCLAQIKGPICRKVSFV